MKKSILTSIILFLTLLFTGCKEKGLGIEVGVDPNGQIYVTIGGSQYPYYDYNYIPNNGSVVVGYITSNPTDETRIPIFDRNNHFICNASLPSGTGSQTNVAITHIRNHFSSGGGPYPVAVDIFQRWTTAPWEGRIVGY